MTQSKLIWSHFRSLFPFLSIRLQPCYRNFVSILGTAWRSIGKQLFGNYALTRVRCIPAFLPPFFWCLRRMSLSSNGSELTSFRFLSIISSPTFADMNPPLSASLTRILTQPRTHFLNLSSETRRRAHTTPHHWAHWMIVCLSIIDHLG